MSKKTISKDRRGPSTSNFRWTKSPNVDMAEYIQSHYNQYKIMSKVAFLRKLKEALKLHITDQQVKNGHDSLIRKYKLVRDKLNSSGFGIDPDLNFEKGWVLKQCPYFEILDAVMATRPNITPPFVIDSTIPTCTVNKLFENSTIDEDIAEEKEFDQTEVVNEVVIIETSAMNTDEFEDMQGSGEESDSEEICNTKDKADAEDKEGSTAEKEKDSQQLKDFVRKNLSGISTQTMQKGPKNALTSFADVMTEKMAMQSDAEMKKLALEEKKFEYTKTLDDKSYDLNKYKIQMETEVSLAKVSAEKEIELQKTLANKDLNNEKMKNELALKEFELKKLELELQLERIKQDKVL